MFDIVDLFVSGSRLPSPGGQGLIPCEIVLHKAAQKGFTSGGLNFDADLLSKAARTENSVQTAGYFR
jgi:hypothetical protein